MVRRRTKDPRNGPKCKGKVRFRDEAHATEALSMIRGSASARAGSPRRAEQRAYECSLCGGWHLTSQAERPKIVPRMPK